MDFKCQDIQTIAKKNDTPKGYFEVYKDDQIISFSVGKQVHLLPLIFKKAFVLKTKSHYEQLSALNIN